MFYCMCPNCASRVPVPFKEIPDDGDGILTHGTWLKSAREGLLHQIHSESAENWARVRQELIQDGIPEKLLEEYGF